MRAGPGRAMVYPSGSNAATSTVIHARGTRSAVRVAEVAAGDIPVVVRAAQVPLPPGVVEAGEVRQPEAVAEALTQMKADGTYEQVLKQWGTESGAIDKFEVNPAR